MGEERTAPVQAQHGGPWRIPWEIHERAWQRYAELGHGSQSAERLAERGGFGIWELAILLAGGNPWAGSGERLTESRRVWGLPDA